MNIVVECSLARYTTCLGKIELFNGNRDVIK